MDTRDNVTGVHCRSPHWRHVSERKHLITGIALIAIGFVVAIGGSVLVHMTESPAVDDLGRVLYPNVPRGWVIATLAQMVALGGVLLILAGILINVGVVAGIFYSPDSISFGHVTATTGGSALGYLAFVLGATFSLNLVLCLLNLLPFPPLDGSGALPLVLPKDIVPRYQDFLWSQPMLGWIGIFVAWQIFDYVFQPVFIVAVNLLYPGVSYQL